MSLLKRLSIRRAPGPQARISPRRADASSTRRAKGSVRCHVHLLDDSTFTCDVDKHEVGNAVLEEVYLHLDVLEKDYFGLSYKDEGVRKWVDPAKHLKKQFKGSHTLSFDFRVKFYAVDPNRLQEELTRYLFYLQVKKDLFTNSLPCSFESSALLGSYIVQAEVGDYDPAKLGPGYVSEFRIIPHQTEELEERIAELHSNLQGKSAKDVEFLFLAYARRLEFYGVELFAARDHHGVELGLGITSNGIAVFKNKTLITTFAWLHVQKITYKRKKFYIELRPEQSDQLQNMVGFHMDTYEGCKQLWKNCIEYHAFFRLMEIKHPPTRGFLKRTRYKYSGRTEHQAIEATKDMAVERSTFHIKRTPSKRFARRAPVRSGGANGHSGVRRTQSLKDHSRPPARAHIKGRIRSLSEEGEDEDDLISPEVSISDDMTGQFSLVSAEEPSKLSLNYRRINSIDKGQGPTEYYDEQSAAEEKAGQVCMDDLSSEGLLLICMEPDERGRYGFNIKGGSDQRVPVIISKVAPDSPGSSCNPALEEGDQILYINGQSVAERCHDDVILMIRASRESTPAELVLIVKPKDLTRVNPPFDDYLNKQFTDPGHILRESLTHLKEMLSSGKALLQFDRLYRRKPGLAAIASRLPQNLAKNRYRDISSYDATRVHLAEGVDYINANYVNIEVESTGKVNRYIAAQGPMQHTCKDFWQMIWEQDSTLVVMLTEVMEGGKVCCCIYWPDLKCSLEYGKYVVKTLSEQTDRISHTRNISMRNTMTSEERQIVLMQYIDWPDHGIPGSKTDFLRFVQGVKDVRGELKGPVVIHCSAGVGRTGVFILMETALWKMDALEPIYPLEIVRRMRDQRGMCVQTPIQFQFACESILCAYEEDYVEIELHN